MPLPLKPLAIAAATLVLAGCGLQPAATQPTLRAGQVKARMLDKLEGPATAKAALTFANVAARQLDAKARFMSLVGTRINPDGAPAAKGTWQISYVGDAVEVPGSNPYNRPVRRIDVTVTAKGETHVAVREEPGMPLGLQLLEAPMPTIDSQDAIKLVRQMAPSPHEGPVAKMVLCAQVTPNQFQRLLWKVTTTRQNGETRISLDAQTGERIGH